MRSKSKLFYPRTHLDSFGLHPQEDGAEHLVEGGLGRGLVDHVLAGQVDVVAGPHGGEQAGLVHLHVLGREDCKQRLKLVFFFLKHVFVQHILLVRPIRIRINKYFTRPDKRI